MVLHVADNAQRDGDKVPRSIDRLSCCVGFFYSGGYYGPFCFGGVTHSGLIGVGYVVLFWWYYDLRAMMAFITSF